MQDNQKPDTHTLTLFNREILTLTGVVDVPGFNEETVSIKTDLGSLVIKGEDLHISRLSLDTGDTNRKGVMSRIFR